jgi:hypothetical protein
MAAVTFSAVTMWIATSKGWGIEGVAVCFLLSSAFLAGLLLRGFLGYYSISFSSRVNHFALLYYPFVYMCLGVWVTRLVSIDYAHTLLADTFSALLRLVLFFISSIPLLVVIQSKTGILSDMRKAVANFLQTKLQRNRSVPLQRDGAP